MSIFIDSPLRWLAAQKKFPKAYIRFGDEEFAAYGALASSATVPQSNERYFGGCDFWQGKRIEEDWNEFPSSYFFLPMVELYKNSRECCLTNRTDEIPVSEDFPLSHSPPPPLQRIDVPNIDDYPQTIEAILSAIARKTLSKVVLARKSCYTFEQPLCPYSLLNSLQNKGNYTFLFQMAENSAFIGSTPEYLYKRDESHLSTVAIAGTRPRGKSQKEDDELADELSQSPKERQEFDFVVRALVDQLSPLSSQLFLSDKEIIKTERVQHLYQLINATIDPSIKDEQLIKTLHPTPATGGWPRSQALSMIAESEPFDRGWYGAPVGFVSKKRTLLLVAIRSALVKKKILQLYAGSGIVTGSQAAAEWQELENKMSQFYLWETRDESEMADANTTTSSLG